MLLTPALLVANALAAPLVLSEPVCSELPDTTICKAPRGKLTFLREARAGDKVLQLAFFVSDMRPADGPYLEYGAAWASWPVDVMAEDGTTKPTQLFGVTGEYPSPEPGVAVVALLSTLPAPIDPADAWTRMRLSADAFGLNSETGALAATLPETPAPCSEPSLAGVTCGVKADPDTPGAFLGTGEMRKSYQERDGYWTRVFRLDFRLRPDGALTVKQEQVFCDGDVEPFGSPCP